MLTGTALLWYETMRLSHHDTTWAFWRTEICKKFGHSAWKRKKQNAFSSDRFIPGETAPAQWVTRQYNWLRCFEPTIDNESINFKLLNLMDNEVEYAAKNAMKKPDEDLSSFINILEDICDKTRLGRRRFPPKSTPTSPAAPAKPPSAVGDKGKVPLSDVKCYSCKGTGHTSRTCPKNVNSVDEEPEADPATEQGSDHEGEGPIIGAISSSTAAVDTSRGRNNLVQMTCCDKDCLVLLDSGAVRSVVGK
ncbi:hypothetical protein PTTG_30893, partial [Puccinia triticina 1-1 BBBD Race 1]